jgi:flagellar assembly factor FliW
MCNSVCDAIGRNHAGTAAQELPQGAGPALPRRRTRETQGRAAAECCREAEAPEIVWVGQQHLMQGYCGRRVQSPEIAPVAHAARVAQTAHAAAEPVESSDATEPPAHPGPDAYRRFQLATARAVRRVAARSLGASGTRVRTDAAGETSESSGIVPRRSPRARSGAVVVVTRGGVRGRYGPVGPAHKNVPGMEFGMEIQSTRFGRLQIDEERVITFAGGLLGFPEQTRFALIQTSDENYFFWLQSADDPDLAFVITDPTIFFKDYDVPIRDEVRQDLEMTDDGFAQVFVICNKVGDWLTGNLLGPLVVNAQNRTGQQVVLTEKKWTTRQPLLRLQAEIPLAKSA